ncbi:MAG: HD domain-containing protein [Armatimonadota bacterium]
MPHDQVIAAMKELFRDAPYGIEHTLAVLKDAEAIMDGEGIQGAERDLITTTVILHDIGVLEAKRKHGSSEAQFQEIEGPIIARQILSDLGYDESLIARVCYIVRHHHSPAYIDGRDFQVQWDADLLVNLEEMEIRNDKAELAKYIVMNFRTATGKSIATARFLP